MRTSDANDTMNLPTNCPYPECAAARTPYPECAAARTPLRVYCTDVYCDPHRYGHYSTLHAIHSHFKIMFPLREIETIVGFVAHDTTETPDQLIERATMVSGHPNVVRAITNVPSKITDDFLKSLDIDYIAITPNNSVLQTELYGGITMCGTVAIKPIVAVRRAGKFDKKIVRFVGEFRP